MFQCLLVQKVLLFVLDLLSVVQCCVHVSVAVCIRDPLHGSGCGFSERNGCVHAVDDAELILLSDLFAFVQLFLALLAFLFFIVRTLLSWYNLFSLSYILLTSKNRERDVVDALVDRLDLSLLLCDGLCQNFQL